MLIHLWYHRIWLHNCGRGCFNWRWQKWWPRRWNLLDENCSMSRIQEDFTHDKLALLVHVCPRANPSANTNRSNPWILHRSKRTRHYWILHPERWCCQDNQHQDDQFQEMPFLTYKECIACKDDAYRSQCGRICSSWSMTFAGHDHNSCR